MPKLFKFQPKSAEWLSKRRENVTATEVCSLFGMDKYKSSNQLLKDKLEPKKLEDNIYMKKGRLLEPSVFIHLQEIGLPAKPADYEQVVMLIDEEHRLAASLDGKMKTDEGNFLVECKSTKGSLFPNWSDRPPVKYLMQVQTQLAVANVQEAILACMNADNILQLIVYKVSSNPEIQEMIRKESKRFWDCHEKNELFVYNPEYREFIEGEIFNGNELIFS